MGCAASKAIPPPPSSLEAVPKPVAFEIPIEEPQETTTKISKKLPPQILQRLEEQNQNNNITVEDLKEKQQKAEERRLSILEEKRRISRQAQKMFSKNEENLQNGEEKENKAS